MRPVHLTRNQPPGRFYRGGEQIARFRGQPIQDRFSPEDWVASVTEVTGEAGVGLTTLPDGRLLRDAVGEEPEAWLGAAHVAEFGTSTEVLTKLLDAGERLPVHIHPSRVFAAQHLRSSHGKAEAWIYLTDGDAHIGFLPDVTEGEILPLLAEGESAPVLEKMHRIDVRAGDVVFCPPGIPHAIGGGSFMVEVQEPADLSIFLEWKDFPLPGGAAGHLGLDEATAASAVIAGVERTEVDSYVTATGQDRGDLLKGAEAPFRAHRLHGGDELDAGFSVLITVGGSGKLLDRDDESFALEQGTTSVVPFAWGPSRLEGEGLEVIVARPPKAPN